EIFEIAWAIHFGWLEMLERLLVRSLFNRLFGCRDSEAFDRCPGQRVQEDQATQSLADAKVPEGIGEIDWVCVSIEVASGRAVVIGNKPPHPRIHPPRPMVGQSARRVESFAREAIG